MAGRADQNPGQRTTILLRGERSEIDRAAEAVLGTMERLGYPEASRFAVRLALEEALSNAIRHGHKNIDPSVPIRLEFSAGTQAVELMVEDQGPGFSPEAVPDPTLDQNLELPTGRGLLLMRAYMASVEYNSTGNQVRMVYRRPAPGAVASP